MLLTCPHCETIFRVDRPAIKAGGRKVRCSVCSNVWLAQPSSADNAAPKTAAPKTAAPKNIISVAAFMVVLAALLMVLATMNRNFIAANAPWTAGLWNVIGMAATPQLEKLEVIQLSGTRLRDTIRVTGALTNRSDWAVLAPSLLLTVRDGTGTVLGQKMITLDLDIIAGGVSTPFATQISLDQQLDDDNVTEIVVVPVTSSNL